jgi:hypothetical protein
VYVFGALIFLECLLDSSSKGGPTKRLKRVKYGLKKLVKINQLTQTSFGFGFRIWIGTSSILGVVYIMYREVVPCKRITCVHGLVCKTCILKAFEPLTRCKSNMNQEK